MIPVTYGTHFQSRQQRSKPSIFRLGMASLRLIGFIALALMSLLYIAQSSEGATKRVEVQSLRSKADELVSEQDQLQLEALRLQSLNTINQSTESLQLENVDSVDYLKK